MSIDEIDYKNGQKNHWRRNLWNLAVEKISVRPKDALVIYLAGASDLDRTEATRRGFLWPNLIAVEKSLGKVQVLRRRGVTAIHGDFFDVVRSFDRPIDFVYGDFCCGLEYSVVQKILTLALFPHFQHSLFAFNFQRGREQSVGSAALREMWARELNVDTPLHRGNVLGCEFACFAWAYANGFIDRIEDGCVVMTGNYFHNDAEMLFERQRAGLFRSLAPTILSYKSRGTRLGFDSVVFKNPLSDLPLGEWPDFRGHRVWKDMRRNIAAALAVRTRRLRGELQESRA